MEPDYTKLGARLQFRTRFIQPEEVDAEYGYAHGHLSEAMMRPFEQIAELVDPPDPYEPWVPLFFLDITPDWALPWLGQAVGVKIPETATPDQARKMIKELSFEKVGTTDAIRTALEFVLTPTDPEGKPTVYFRERDGGDAYYLEVITLDSETTDPIAALNAIQSQLPAGIKLRYDQVPGWDYEAMTTDDGPYSALDDTYSTYKLLTDKTPG